MTLITLLSPIAIYTGVLMSRTRNMLAAQQGHEPLTMGEAARLTLGGHKAATAIYSVVYGFGFLGQASYLLVLGQTLQGIFYEYELCLPHAILASCGICLPFVMSVRHLADSVWLCFVNLLTILVVLMIVMGQLAHNGRREGVQTFLFAEDLTVFTVFGAITNILLSYTGHWLYFELMAEMHEPEEFPRVFSINAPVQVSLYLLVACWGYYYAGNTAAGYFLDNLPNGMAYQLASGLLFVHVIVAFLIKNVVLSRFLHGLISPSRVSKRWSEPGGGRAHAEHVCCAVLVLVACFLMANVVPFFMEFLGLIGGFLSGPISFILPMVFYAVAQRRMSEGVTGFVEENVDVDIDTKAPIGVAKLPGPLATSGQPCDPIAVDRPRPTPCRASAPWSSQALAQEGLCKPLLDVSSTEGGEELRTRRRCASATLGLSRLDLAFFLVVGILTILTMVVGTYDVLLRIIANLDEFGPPFSCKVLSRDRVR